MDEMERRGSMNTPTSTVFEFPDEDGLSIIVHASQEGVIVDWYDEGRRDSDPDGVDDPYMTLCLDFDQLREIALRQAGWSEAEIEMLDSLPDL